MVRAQGNAQLIQKLTDVSTATSQAYAAGDTAKASQLQRELYQLAGFARADTLAIDKKCGQVPPVHPAQIRLDALNAEGNDVLAKIRALDEQAIQVQKEKSGMNGEQPRPSLGSDQEVLRRRPLGGIQRPRAQGAG